MRPFATLLALLLVVAACTSSGATPAPSGGSSPSAGPVTNADDAARLALATNPTFGGLAVRNTDLIGQCCWYEVVPADGGYQVDVEIGWGDCPSGCIDRHHWTYRVTSAGEVSLLAETGPSLAPGAAPGGAGY